MAVNQIFVLVYFSAYFRTGFYEDKEFFRQGKIKARHLVTRYSNARHPIARQLVPWHTVTRYWFVRQLVARHSVYRPLVSRYSVVKYLVSRHSVIGTWSQGTPSYGHILSLGKFYNHP